MIRAFVFGLAAAVLGGCSQLGGLSGDDSRQRQWQARLPAIEAVEHWDIYARAALRLERQAYNIGIRWRRDRADFTLLLEAPFGQGVFRIRAVGGADYRLQLPDGQQFGATTPEALLEDVVGWSLPISGLEYWVRGLPRPGSRYAQRLDRAGRSLEIDQDGWTIAYLDYFDGAAPVELPRRIDLASEAVGLKLVIERWQQAGIADDAADIFPEFDP